MFRAGVQQICAPLAVGVGLSMRTGCEDVLAHVGDHSRSADAKADHDQHQQHTREDQSCSPAREHAKQAAVVACWRRCNLNAGESNHGAFGVEQLNHEDGARRGSILRRREGHDHGPVRVDSKRAEVARAGHLPALERVAIAVLDPCIAGHSQREVARVDHSNLLLNGATPHEIEQSAFHARVEGCVHRFADGNVKTFTHVQPLAAAVGGDVDEHLQGVGGRRRAWRGHDAKACGFHFSRSNDLGWIGEGDGPAVWDQACRPCKAHQRRARVFNVHVKEGEITVDRHGSVLRQRQDVLQLLSDHQSGRVADEELGAFSRLELVGVGVALFRGRGHQEKVGDDLGCSGLQRERNACFLVNGDTVDFCVVCPFWIAKLHGHGQVHRHVAEVRHQRIKFHQFCAVHLDVCSQCGRTEAFPFDGHVHREHGLRKHPDFEDFHMREVWVCGRCDGAHNFGLVVGRRRTVDDRRHRDRDRHGQILQDVKRFEIEGGGGGSVQPDLPSVEVHRAREVVPRRGVSGVHDSNGKGDGSSGLCSNGVTVGQQGPRDADQDVIHAPHIDREALRMGDEGLVGVACLDVHHIRARSGVSVRAGTADDGVKIGQNEGQVPMVTRLAEFFHRVRTGFVEAFRPRVFG